MAGHMGDVRVTTLNLKVVRTDASRGLLLVAGAVPGADGGWITVRDAVKHPLPKEAPKPGKFISPGEARPAHVPVAPPPKAEATPKEAKGAKKGKAGAKPVAAKPKGGGKK